MVPGPLHLVKYESEWPWGRSPCKIRVGMAPEPFHLLKYESQRSPGRRSSQEPAGAPGHARRRKIQVSGPTAVLDIVK